MIGINTQFSTTSGETWKHTDFSKTREKVVYFFRTFFSVFLLLKIQVNELRIININKCSIKSEEKKLEEINSKKTESILDLICTKCSKICTELLRE